MSTNGQQPTSKRASQTDFDPEALLSYLRQHLPELSSSLDARDLSINPISGGQSNPTYFVTIGDRELVLRKAPNGELLPGAHRVDREYRVMDALAGSGVPVPEMVRLEEDKNLLGAPFYLMERLHGQVFHESTLPDHTPRHDWPSMTTRLGFWPTFTVWMSLRKGSRITVARVPSSADRSTGGPNSGSFPKPGKFRKLTSSPSG